MCASSMVYDYGMRQWPNVLDRTYMPHQPLIPNVTTEAEKKALEAFRKLVDEAAKFDKEASQPECEDPAKAYIMERILQRLEEIEKRLNIET